MSLKEYNGADTGLEKKNKINIMKKTITEYFQKSFAIGVGLTAGIMATALMAATVSGVIHIFFPGQAVSSSQINENFASLKTAVESVDIPVGTILAWHKNLGGVPALSGNWVECDGSVINDSASDLHGQTLPDLNGAYVDASAKSHKRIFPAGTFYFRSNGNRRLSGALSWSSPWHSPVIWSKLRAPLIHLSGEVVLPVIPVLWVILPMTVLTAVFVRTVKPGL